MENFGEQFKNFRESEPKTRSSQEKLSAYFSDTLKVSISRRTMQKWEASKEWPKNWPDRRAALVKADHVLENSLPPPHPPGIEKASNQQSPLPSKTQEEPTPCAVSSTQTASSLAVDGELVGPDEPWPVWNQDPGFHIIRPKFGQKWPGKSRLPLDWDPNKLYKILQCDLAFYEKSAADAYRDTEESPFKRIGVCPFHRTVWELFWFYKDLPPGEVAVKVADLKEQALALEPTTKTTNQEPLMTFVADQQSVEDGKVDLAAYKQANSDKIKEAAKVSAENCAKLKRFINDFSSGAVTAVELRAHVDSSLRDEIGPLPHESGFAGGKVLKTPADFQQLEELESNG